MQYPPKDFLRDFAAWHKAPKHRGSQEAAKFVFSLQYGKHQDVFSYRFNRFICIMDALHTQLPALVHDRIALSDGGKGGLVPEPLMLALHQWYCSLTNEQMQVMPDPDWNAVLEIYDEQQRNDRNA